MKTMHSVSAILVSCLLLFNGCLKDDIDDLKKQQADQAERIAALEAWQQTVNTNITALQGLVTALEAKDFVTAVTPKLENGVEVGYTITFSKSGPVAIYHGTKGDTPVIGVAQDTDGRYYWTVQTGSAAADWIKDSKGANIPTTGLAPQVRINTSNEWEISSDGGATWKSTGVKATGPQGATGATGPTGGQGDAIFAANGVDNSNTDYVVFTLADGTTKIKVPKYIALGITFDQPDFFKTGETKLIGYTLQGTAPAVMTAVNLPAGWKVSFDKTAGQIKVTAPVTITDDNAAGEAVILLSDGGERTVARVLSLTSTGPVSNEIGAYYYLKGVIAGVVYETKKENRKGLVVSLDEAPSTLRWGPINETAATDVMDGRVNMAAIKTINSDYSNYPAFQWVYQKNGNTDGPWYLPSLNELMSLYAGYCGLYIGTGWSTGGYAMPGYDNPACVESRATFDNILTSVGGVGFTGAYYWSSTEFSDGVAWHVDFTDGDTYSDLKASVDRVRAVLAF